MDKELTVGALAGEVLDGVGDAVVVVDARGHIVYANEVVADLFGYARDELLGRPTEVLVPETSRATHARVREAYGRQPTRRSMGTGLPLEARRRDGSIIPVDIKLEPLSTNGWVVASIRPVAGDDRAVAAALDTVVQHLFAIGMSLSALASSADPPTRVRLADALDLVDRTLRLVTPCRADPIER
jgi:PAS domain S-box-containing protein